MTIEKHAFERFMRDFRKGKYGNQRLGQAFYNCFSLHKMADQDSIKNLYAKDGKHASNLIKTLFEFA